MRTETRKRKQEQRLSKLIESLVSQRTWMAFSGQRLGHEDRLLQARQDILYLLSDRIDQRR